ncbi:MAG: hypothetical protein JWM33_2173 [Caulobacteraceae bacterium]|nr:hypothetical protein [Caulobacteraceae bacterium]
MRGSLLFCVIAALFATGMAAPSKVVDASTIDNFKRFCIDTGGRADRVFAAAKAAGLKRSSDLDYEYRDADKAHLVVAALNAPDSKPILGDVELETCTIIAYPGKPGDVKALHDSLGLPSPAIDHLPAEGRLWNFYVQERRGTRRVIPNIDGAAGLRAMRAGELRAEMVSLVPNAGVMMSYAVVHPAKPPRKEAFSALEQLQKLCVETRAEPEAVHTAALAAGYRPDAHDPRLFRVGGAVDSVTLQVGAGEMTDAPEGAIAVKTCTLYVFPGTPSDIFAVQRWLGAKAMAAEGGSYVASDDSSGRRALAADQLDAKKAALAAGTLRLIKITPLRPEGVMVFYGVESPLKQP